MDHDDAVLMLKAIAKAFDEHDLDGDRGASEWTLSGTTTEGQRIEVRGCDLWTLRDGAIVKKDSYWKIRTTG
jgi:ketosteroid isomerase-like protein